MAAVFETRPRDDWVAVMAGADACCTPVLDMEEAMAHPHHAARNTFVEVDGTRLPAPAPRFSRTVPEARPRRPDTAAGILSEFGFSPGEIAALTPG